MIRKSMPSDLIRGWVPVFPRDKREAFARRSCSNKKIERDDDSKKSHPAPEDSRCRRSCHSKNRDHAGRCSASAPTGFASARPKTFSDATFAAAISTRGITYGFWIMKARCRTRRKIKCSSATGSSARDGGACGPRTTMMSNIASPWHYDTAAFRCWLWHHGSVTGSSQTRDAKFTGAESQLFVQRGVICNC